MAIQKNAGGGGKYIRESGEYRVKVTETKVGLSKSQKPMLTVILETEDGKSIAGYFVRGLDFHIKTLGFLKAACGLKPTDQADKLVGRECGISVVPGKVAPYMEIAGYGPASDVSGVSVEAGAANAMDARDGHSGSYGVDDSEVPF